MTASAPADGLKREIEKALSNSQGAAEQGEFGSRDDFYTPYGVCTKSDLKDRVQRDARR